MNGSFSRRHILKSLYWGAGASILHSVFPVRLSFAKTTNNKRLLVVIMRGAMDGLAAVIPHGDTAYADARGNVELLQGNDDLIMLDSYFALHNSLAPLAELYQKKQMLICHAVTTPYRDRSHFDAQDLLENGTDKPHLLTTGWLNRAIAAISDNVGAMAVGSAVPLMLRGSVKVGSWQPSSLPDVDDDFLKRVMHMYQSDAKLLDALTNAQKMQEIVGEEMPTMNARGQKSFIATMERAASFMSPANGVSVATVEIGGWDTHANQVGRLKNNFKMLAEGIIAFQKAMNDAWKDTAVLAITEFGRTVKGNGTGGTDHGTAGVAFLFGGALDGGKIVGDWPTLAKLYEDRDLMPANDLRGLIKSTLKQHFSIDKKLLDENIFPNSKKIWIKDKLFV